MLTGLLLVACSAFFLITEDHMPRVGTAHSGLGPSRQSLIKKMPPQTPPQANLMEASPQLRFPLPGSHWLCPGDRNEAAQPSVLVCASSPCQLLKSVDITLGYPDLHSTPQIPALSFFLPSRIFHHSPPWLPSYVYIHSSLQLVRSRGPRGPRSIRSACVQCLGP